MCVEGGERWFLKELESKDFLLRVKSGYTSKETFDIEWFLKILFWDCYVLTPAENFLETICWQASIFMRSYRVE